MFFLKNWILCLNKSNSVFKPLFFRFVLQKVH